jgi:hypothetical protein
VTATWQRVSTWFTPLKGIDPYVELAVHLTPLFYFSRLELASSPPPAEPVAPSPFPPPLPAPVFPPLPSIAFPKLSILLRLNNLSPKEFAEGEKGGKPIYETNLGTARWSDIVQVPSLYSGLADDGNTIWRYCAARVTAKFFDMIRGDSLLQSYIYRLSLGRRRRSTCRNTRSSRRRGCRLRWSWASSTMVLQSPTSASATGMAARASNTSGSRTGTAPSLLPRRLPTDRR